MALIQLLRFVDIEQLECLDISGNSNVFKACTCKTKIECTAIECLCSTLSKNKNISSIQLAQCGLTDGTVSLITASLLDKHCLKELDLNKNKLRTFGLLLKVLENGTSLKLCGMFIVPKESVITITELDSDDDNDVLDALELFESFQLPIYFHEVDFECNYFAKNIAVSILKNNSHLLALRVHSHSFDEACATTVKISEALTAHKSLQSFHGFGIEFSETLFNIADMTCAKCLLLLMDIQKPSQLDEISLINCSESFEDCLECNISKEAVENKLCALLSNTQMLKRLNLNCCKLKEDFVFSVITCIENYFSKQLQCIELSGNSVGKNNLKNLLRLLIDHENIRLYVQESNLRVRRNQLEIESYSELNLLASLLLPTEINHIKVNNEYYEIPAHTLVCFLSNNPHLIDIEYFSWMNSMIVKIFINLQDKF